MSRRLASSMLRFHLKAMALSQSVPAAPQVCTGTPKPNVASFRIASRSKDSAIALRTRGSDVGADWVLRTNCLMPTVPMGMKCKPLSAPLFMRSTKVGPKRSETSMSPA